MSETEIVDFINATHKCPETLAPVESKPKYNYQTISENTVYVAPYDANQLILYSYASEGEPFDADREAIVSLYNEYFGGSMNSIVFQEMREARGLAYSAAAYYNTPTRLDRSCYFMDFIQTQNDKLMDALGAFDEIINNMPVSETLFNIAKEGLLSNIRTQRTVKSSVLFSYMNARDLGLDYDINKSIFEKVQDYTIDDVVKFQQESVKDRKYNFCILGRESDFDMEALSKIGTVKHLTTEEIFGY